MLFLIFGMFAAERYPVVTVGDRLRVSHIRTVGGKMVTMNQGWGFAHLNMSESLVFNVFFSE